MSQLENCIRGLHGRSVALNLTNRLIKKAFSVPVCATGSEKACHLMMSRVTYSKNEVRINRTIVSAASCENPAIV